MHSPQQQQGPTGHTQQPWPAPGHQTFGDQPHGYPHAGFPHPGYPAPGPPQPGYGHPGPDDPTDVVGARFAQGAVDYLLVLVPFFVLYFASIALSIAAYSASSDLSTVGTLVSLVSTLAWLLLPAGMWFLNAWWPHKHNGQTVAMRWLKLRIVDEHGGAATLGALTLRALLLLVDGFFLGVVGLIIMSTNPRHQRLGDQVAKTLVIRAS